MTKIADAKILIVATNGFEQSELEVPRDKLREHGATVHVVSPDGEKIKGWTGPDWDSTVDVDHALTDISDKDYHALVLPGGQINPDTLRLNEDVISLIKRFADAGKPIAAVCHAPWLLIDAGLVEGREVTAWPSVRTDLANAGGKVVDKPVACEDAIITSRNPDDLDAFVAKIVEEVEEGRHEDLAA
ncbi:type 1 glutamine amidotransferase domain-containing protein [Jannaschia sp. 2305UL9-9]|uniref:type 1 glutamine amidotransferase domain-containing protein n=1 Tax=Jannaschia sp. 2305UL9-9 TaxID=3121638 RepID=UPI003529600B